MMRTGRTQARRPAMAVSPGFHSLAIALAASLLIVASFVAMGAMSGCATRIAASPDRGRIVLPAPLAADDWPLRHAATITGSPGAANDSGEMNSALTTPWNLAILANPDLGSPGWWQAIPIGQYGNGVVFAPETSENGDDDGDGDGDSTLDSTMTGGAEMSASRGADAGYSGADGERRAWWLFATTSLTPTDLALARLGEDATRATEDGRVRAVACVLSTPDDRRAKGLVLFLPSLTSGAPERALRRRLLEAGWAVLEIVRPADGQTIGAQPIAGLNGSDQISSEARFLPRELLDRATAFDLWLLPLYDYSLTIGYQEDLRASEEERAEATVRYIAASFDSIVADWAYAAEGMVEFLAARRPDIPTRPLVVIGCSLGAIVAPTVCARLGERQVDAVVLIGGGANIAHIFTGTSMPGMTAGRSWEATRALGHDRLHEIYLEASKLDPYHTAPALARTPVLMLHAMFDAIVPASTGRLLYQRLRRPEVWEYPVGHLGLFLLVPIESNRIVRWIERHVAQLDAFAAGAGQPAPDSSR